MVTVVLSLRAVYEVAHIEGEKPGFLNRKIRAYRSSYIGVQTLHTQRAQEI